MDLKSLVGTVVDNKFEILSLIGAGGMGSVFKARQLDLERFVAIKFLSPSLVAHADSAGRFEREARAIAKLEHEHIAMFYSYGIFEGGLPYIVMEYLDGVSLNRLIQDGIDWKRALKICRQVCQSMSYAHAAGILHRDIKPENIILSNLPESDWVKVVDFGLAKLSDTDESVSQKLTKTGELIGSIYYLSPEQCAGQKADERSDIYSLSCVLYQMLCGRTPFECDNPIGMIHKHVNEQAIRPGEKLKSLELPPYLDDVVMKGLSKKADDRYQSMQQFDSDLRLIEQSKQDELSFKPKKSSLAKSYMPALLLSAFVMIIAAASY
ncbi:MAG: serine/threonine protein kinase, partial [Candidatus Obscuribacterales bacterium]|nr:serine/threonine protein kinase [Candidatus Obscuribacterales bacterium]